MRLLVLRPQPDADDTAARLRQLGHEVLVRPLLHTEHLPPPTDIPSPAAIVLTSRNGVRSLERWPQAAGWRGLPVFAVGMETAAEAQASGFRAVRAGAGDAAALARMIANEFDRSAGLILYPAARDRAVDLAGTLTAAGFTVRRVEAYRAVAAAELGADVVEALRSGAIDGILFFSRRSAAIFADLAKKAKVAASLSEIALFALSETVAEALSDLGPGAIRVAGHPDADSLFSLLPRGD